MFVHAAVEIQDVCEVRGRKEQESILPKQNVCGVHLMLMMLYDDGTPELKNTCRAGV